MTDAQKLSDAYSSLLMAFVNSQDEQYLAQAADLGRVDVVRFFLGRGVDPDAASSGGPTPPCCSVIPAAGTSPATGA